MLEKPELTDNALEVLKRRYYQKDADGTVIEDWEGLCRRVAKFVSDAERAEDRQMWFGVFLEMIHNLDFLPNSPTLFNAGLALGNLSACYVLPVKDSLEDIFDTVKNAAIIFASGGGCGYDFSDLRKRGSPVSRTSGVSSGPVSFIRVFNASTEVIKQGGKRRGANMGVLRVDHPDIMEFLDAKAEEGDLANFNLSVAVTDKFMAAAEQDKDFTLYDRYLDQPGETIRARDLFAKIVDHAWLNGEPGIIFLDEVNRKHPLQELGNIAGVNPCGEQPLLPNESCNLGSINLVRFFDPENSDIDWTRLSKMVGFAIRFLDDVIDQNRYPVPEIGEVSRRSRKVGLGVMGWADLLLLLGLSYDSDEAIHLAEKLMEFLEYYALQYSVELAESRGSFPDFENMTYIERPESSWDPSFNWEGLTQQIQARGLRNACVTSIAPTGSLSLIAGVSSGIEPVFQWVYKYHRVEREFTEKHPLAAPYLERGEPLPSYYVTALEVEPGWHVRMQAAFQKWNDSGISKTINMPPEATREDVTRAIMEAWWFKCKGVTLYRSGSRQQEVLVRETEEVKPRERPHVTEGRTMRISVGEDCGHLFVTVNCDEVGPCESFVTLGKGGGCVNSHVEALGRMVSLALRSGIEPADVIDQLSHIRCSQMRWAEGRAIQSCPDAVAYALEQILGLDETSVEGNPKRVIVSAVELGENPECPECSNMLYRESRCLSCRACGYSKCVG